MEATLIGVAMHRNSWARSVERHYNDVYTRLKDEFLLQNKVRLSNNDFGEFFMNTFVYNNIHNLEVED